MLTLIDSADGVRYLDTNKLTGTIPTELGGARLLKSVFLASNLLTGTIPTEVGNWPELTSL